MAHLTRIKEAEIRIILGLIIISLLNVIIFRSLSVGYPISLVINDIVIYIYGICIVAMVGFTLIKRQRELDFTFYTLLFLLTANIVLNLFDLILDKRISDNGTIILLDAFIIWISSLGVFSFWYWLIDRGGPIARAEEREGTRYDLLFPQYQSKIPGWDNWKPTLWDYLVFSFFTSTGFSPADTLPLSIRAKVLMMVEAAISLIIIGMVASRAISLFQ